MANDDSSILNEIHLAREMFLAHGQRLLADPMLGPMIRGCRENSERSKDVFTEAGVFIQCAACAARDNSSCCFEGVEKWFGAMMLLINLLMGVELPEVREIEGHCLFLGPTGCKIKNRYAICINFFCPSLRDYLGPEQLKALRKQGGDEIWAGVELENALTAWIKRQTPA